MYTGNICENTCIIWQSIVQCQYGYIMTIVMIIIIMTIIIYCNWSLSLLLVMLLLLLLLLLLSLIIFGLLMRIWEFIDSKQRIPCAAEGQASQIAKFMGPTRGPPGSSRPQMGPMLAPWTLLSWVVPNVVLSSYKDPYPRKQIWSNVFISQWNMLKSYRHRVDVEYKRNDWLLLDNVT